MTTSLVPIRQPWDNYGRNRQRMACREFVPASALPGTELARVGRNFAGDIVAASFANGAGIDNAAGGAEPRCQHERPEQSACADTRTECVELTQPESTDLFADASRRGSIRGHEGQQLPRERINVSETRNRAGRECKTAKGEPGCISGRSARVQFRRQHCLARTRVTSIRTTFPQPETSFGIRVGVIPCGDSSAPLLKLWP